MNRKRPRHGTRRAVARSPHRGHRIVAGKRKHQPRVGSAGQRPHLSLVRSAEPAVRPPPPTPVYEWLSAEDRMFLKFERPNTHMHVGATLLFEGGPLLTAARGVDARRIRHYIGAHLSAIPRYRQRLYGCPPDGQPVWVDDAHFDLAAHVRHVRLGRPGDAQALHRLAGRIFSEPLDRSRPLWEMWIVDGLADGRFAVVNKMHHCMVDGIAGADLLSILLTPTPIDDVARAPHWVPRPAPTPVALLRGRAARNAESARAAARELWHVVRHPSRGAQWARYAAGLWQALGLGLRPAPDSPFNRPIGARRRFAWLTVDLDEVKQVKSHLGGTVNDLVLATVAGALRRFLNQRDPDGTPPDHRALVPVNTRTAAAPCGTGNHVAAWIVPLPVGEADPLDRLARIRTITTALKGANDVLGAELLSAAGSTLLSLGARLVERLRPYNLVITNVPGPPLPLYLLGARLQHVYPLVPLFPNQGLGIAVFSYADTLSWGFNADCHVVPDLDRFAAAVGAAFDELRDAAGINGQQPRRAASNHR